MSAHRCRDRGAVLVLTALLSVVLIIFVAMVIDLGATRSDRRTGQLAVDSATASAGQALATTDAEEACETAAAYLQLALNATLSVSSGSCAGLVDCSATAPVVLVGDGFTAEIHHPVPNSSPLMKRTSTVGVNESTLAADRPGDPCDRFGVLLRTTASSFFGGVVGQKSRTSTAHAVVVAAPPPDGDRLVNLAVLERTGCNAIIASGNGGVIARAVSTPTGTFPGLISVDSSAGRPSGIFCEPVVNVSGGPAEIRADGPLGCDTETKVGTGEGCGVIGIFAPGTPGCNNPACSSTGKINPPPSPLERRVTREPIDHIYNCKSATAYASEEYWYAEHPIGGCPDRETRPAFITQLRSKIGASGTPAGFTSYVGAGHPCSPGPGTTTITTGNWHIDCPDPISMNSGTLVFEGGNLVFDQAPAMNSSAALEINTKSSAVASSNPPLDITSSSPANAFVYLRDGTLSKGAQARLTIRNSMVFVSRGETLSLGGGDKGALSWTAPLAGPFKDLALWSDSEVTHDFNGQASLTLEGAFFVPVATISYTGQSKNDVTAQFIAERLEAKGKGALDLKPTRGIPLPVSVRVVQIVR